jgi:hypothetical protein
MTAGEHLSELGLSEFFIWYYAILSIALVVCLVLIRRLK